MPSHVSCRASHNVCSPCTDVDRERVRIKVENVCVVWCNDRQNQFQSKFKSLTFGRQIRLYGLSIYTGTIKWTLETLAIRTKHWYYKHRYELANNKHNVRQTNAISVITLLFIPRSFTSYSAQVHGNNLSKWGIQFDVSHLNHLRILCKQNLRMSLNLFWIPMTHTDSKW